MNKRLFSVLLAFAAVLMPLNISFTAMAEENYYIFWESDFDKGYSYEETAIKGFDTYTDANVLNPDNTKGNPPAFWDGTWNYTAYANSGRDYNAKVVRKVENGNGMLSFQHQGSGITYGTYVEKTLGELKYHAEVMVEYKVRFTVSDNGTWAFYLRNPASSSTSSLLQGPYFGRNYKTASGISGRIDNYDNNNNDNDIPFTYGSAKAPSTKWYKVCVVHSNVTNTRKTFIDGVLMGEADNNKNAAYYKNGIASLRFEMYCLGNGTVVDIDDIRVMTGAKLTAGAVEILQKDEVISEFEYSDEPIKARTRVTNISTGDRNVTLCLAGYSKDADGARELKAFEISNHKIAGEEERIIETGEMILPSGVSELSAFVWENITPLTEKETVERLKYVAPDGSFPEFGKVRSLGNCAFARKINAASTGMTELGLRTYITMIGTPSYVYEFDGHTGEYIYSYQSGSGLHHSIKVGSDGKVYTMPSGSPDLWVYDPVTRENKLIKADICNGSTSWHINYGADNDRSMLYSTIYNGKYATEGTPVVEYDIDNQKINVYTGFDIGCKYAHVCTGDDKYVFVASGDVHGTEKVTRHNKQTGERIVWKNDTGRTQGQMSFIKVIGKYLFVRIGSYINVFDKETMERVDEIEGGRGQYDCVSDPDPSNPDIVYYNTNGGKKLNSYNLKTGETIQVMDTDTYYGNIVRYDFARWFPNENGVQELVGTGGNESSPRMFRLVPSEKTFETYLLDLESENLGVPTRPNYFYITRDDILYVGGYEAGLNGFDLKTNTPLFSVSNENQHAMTMVNGKLFGGCYNSGKIYMYDPKKSAGVTNPREVGGGKAGICRHYDASDTNAGFGLIVGIADYGGADSGGVYLVSYYNNSPKVKYYGAVIPGENITSAVYRNGYIYASSSVNVPLFESHEEAHIAKIDAKTGTVVQISAVSCEGVGKFTQLGELDFGPDGLLYGVGNNGYTVFALNPDDLSLEKYHSYYPSQNPAASVAGEELIFGAEGLLYAILNSKIHAIDIETFETKIVWDSADRFAIDNDGNILKRSGSSSTGTALASIPVNQRQRLEIMRENAAKYYKEADYTKKSWAEFSAALQAANELELEETSGNDVKAAARRLTFAIKDLQTVFDYEAGFAYPFK